MYARKEVSLQELRLLPRPFTKDQAAQETRLHNALDGREHRKREQAARGIEVGKFVGTDHPWLLETPKCIRYNAVIALVKAHDSNVAKREAMKRRGEPRKHRFRLQYRTRKRLWRSAGVSDV